MKVHFRGYLARIPLSFLLTVPFLLLVSGAVATVGYLSYESGRRSIEALIDRLTDQVSERVGDRLAGYLRTPHDIVQLSATALENGELNPDDFRQLEKDFLHKIRAFRSLSTLTFGNTRGEVVGAGRDRSGFVARPNRLTVWEALGKAPNTRRFYEVDERGERREKVLHITKDFDVRQRVWYRAAVTANRETWSPVFPVLNLPVATVSAVAPVYRNGRLQGVVSSDLLLPDIGWFLASLRISPGGRIFITDRSGYLVAASTAEKPFLLDQGRLTRVSAQDSSDPAIRAAAFALPESQSRGRQRFDFTLDGQRHFAWVQPYTDGLDWSIVTVIPEADFTADIAGNNRQTLLLSGLTLLLAGGIGILTARAVVAPIRRLQRAANALTRGELDYPVQGDGLGEVASLAGAFRKMAGQLDRSFRSLEASERRFSTLLREVPIGISVFDATGQQILLNRSGEGILGCGVIATEIDRLSDIYKLYIAGTDTPYPVEALPVSLALRGLTVSADDIEVEVNGERIPLEVRAIPILDETGGILYAILAFQDISERRESERTRAIYERELEKRVAQQREIILQNEAVYRAIVNALPDSLFRLRRDGTYLDLHLTPDAAVYPFPLTEGTQAVIEQAIESGDVQVYEFPLLEGDREYRKEARVVRLTDGSVLAIVRDITERYGIERIKDEFISVVSHELRTPLTAIRGSLGLLNSGFYAGQPDRVAELLTIALNNSERLTRLINDILDLERLQSGKTKLVKEPCQVAALTQQAIESVGVLAESAGVTLIQETEDLEIFAAPDALVQTLTNLLSNAIKFSPCDSVVSLTTSIERQDNHSFLRFAVRDCGTGIPADKLTSIFDRFQQVNVSDSRRKGGTGLGLAICKSIVGQHGGKIWVESVLGEGSVFYFTIPLDG
jgi:signal transduction histidine kinase